MDIANLLKSAEFILGASKLSQLPSDQGIEVAFAGRSNAGKSSVLNILTQQKHLARTSKTPGRTQQINVFKLDETRRLIDLPGYGYAKVSLKVKKEWQNTLNSYLQKRDCLKGIILVMDIRHPLKAFDCMLLDWACVNGLPIHVLLNKSDKLKKGSTNNTLLAVQKTLQDVSDLVSAQIFSALKKQGMEQCYKKLQSWFIAD